MSQLRETGVDDRFKEMGSKFFAISLGVVIGEVIELFETLIIFTYIYSSK